MSEKPRHAAYVPPLRRKFNNRFALILVAVFAISAGLIHVVQIFQVDRNLGLLLRLAVQQQRSGRLDEAVRTYARYLAYRPNDLDAFDAMGQLVEETAVSYETVVRSYLTFEAMLRQDPTRDDVRQRIVDVALMLQKYSVALAHLKALQKSTPNDPDIHFKTAKCLEGLGRYSEAFEKYALSIKISLDRIDFYTQLVGLVLKHGADLPLKKIDPLQRDDATPRLIAEYFMDEAVDKGRPQFEAYLTRANFRRQLGRLDEAAEDMAQAVELTADNAKVLLAAADLSVDRAAAAKEAGNPKVAEEFLVSATEYARLGMEADPSELRFFVTRSKIELARENRLKAAGILRSGIERYGEIQESATADSLAQLRLMHHQLLFSLADLLISLAQPDTGAPDAAQLAEARTLIDRLPPRGPLKALGEFLKARLLIADHKWFSARTILQSTQIIPVPLTDLRRRISLELSRCFQQLHNPDARLETVRRTVSDDPLWMRGRLEIAAALADANRIDEAIIEYQFFRRVPGVPTTVIRLLMFEQLTRPVDRRNWDEVERMLVLADEVMPNSPLVPALRAELLVQQQRYSAAESLLTTAADRFADDVGVRTSSALLAVKRPSINAAAGLANAERILDEAETALGDHVEFRLARAELAVLKDYDQALRDLSSLQKKSNQFNNDDRFQLLSGLARKYLQIKAADKARRLWAELANLYPNKLMVRLVLVQLYADAADQQQRRHWLAEIREIEGAGGPNGDYEEAVAIIDQLQDRQSADTPLRQPTFRLPKPQLDRARQLLSRAAQSRPNWSALPRALGILEDLAGNSGDAFKQFQRAIEMGDRSREVISRVVQGLFLRKRYDEADRELRRLETEQPDVISGNLARLAWRVAWQRQQFERALGLADSVASQSNDFLDFIWTAQLRFARGLRGKDVEQPLRDAIDAVKKSKAGPKSPAPWLAMVAYLTRISKFDEARDTIADAQSELPKAIAALTAARCYETLDETPSDIQSAEQYYLQALEFDPQNVSRLVTIADFYTRRGKSAKAAPYLEKILDPRLAAPDFARSWASRRQLMVLASSGSYADSERALKGFQRISNNNNAGGWRDSALQDLRAKAAIHASRATRRDRKAAILIYEEIARLQRLSTEEQFRLAQLYNLTGDWSKVRTLLIPLITAETPSGRHIAYYVQALIRRDQTDDAQLVFTKLKQVEPNTFQTVITEARLLAARGRSALAAPLIVSYLQKRRTATESLKDLLSQQNAGEVMNLLESYLRDQLDGGGIRVIQQTRELLARDETAEAVSLLAKYVESRRLTGASQAVLYRLAASLCEEIGELNTAEQLFRKYVGSSDNPQAVFLQAKFLARHDRLDEALLLCRQARPQTERELLVSAAVSVVSHGRPTDSQLTEVQTWVDEVLRSKPDSSAAMIALGDLRLLQRKFSEAEDLYRRLLKRNPQNVAALNNLAWLLAYENRQLAEARQLIAKAIKITGPIAQLLDTRAMIHLAEGKPDRAVDDLTEAFVNTISPFSAIGHLHLAEAYLQANKLDLARQMFEKSRQYGLSAPGLHPLEHEKYKRVANALAAKAKRKVTATP